jgi:hypothetical protein
MVGKSRNVEKKHLEAANDISAIVAKKLSSQLENRLPILLFFILITY